MSSPEQTGPGNIRQTRRHKRGEMPKPIIRRGTLGLFPLSPVSVSYLAESHGDIVIGCPDTAETHAFRNRSTLTVLREKHKEELSLEGRFFNGFADALYRGRLSEVILAVPTEEGLPALLEDFADYLEKLLSLGFFLPKKEIIKRDPVADLVPHFILTGDGLLFSRFITGLMRYLHELGARHGILTEALRTRILGRFVRGLDAPESAIRLPHTALLAAGARQVTLVDVPKAICIAGGAQESQRIIESVLFNHGLAVTIETRSRNAVERLEFGQAMWRITRVIIPALADEKALGEEAIRKEELKTLAPRVEAGILAIGRQRRAFDETDSPATILPTTAVSTPAPRKQKGGDGIRARKGAADPEKSLPLSGLDASILQSLGFYADALGLAEEKRIFENLASRVNARIATPD